MADQQTREQRLEQALRELIWAYVNTIENGRDRIRQLGGECDPVDVMEGCDPYLKRARDALASGVNALDGEQQ